MIAIGASIASDTLVEIFGGIVPIWGDLADLIQIGINLSAFGFRLPSLVSLMEFLPIVGDILPCHIASSILAYRDMIKKE